MGEHDHLSTTGVPSLNNVSNLDCGFQAVQGAKKENSVEVLCNQEFREWVVGLGTGQSINKQTNYPTNYSKRPELARVQELVSLLHGPVSPVLGEEVHEAVRLVQAVRFGEVGAAVDLREGYQKGGNMRQRTFTEN